METFKRFLEIIDVNIVLCLIPMVLTLIITEKVFPKRLQTKRALNVVRYLIIIYTFINLLYFIIGCVKFPDDFAFINRVKGPYAITYLLMIFGALILPLTLFNKRLGLSFFYVIAVSFFLKSGKYFETFIIIITSIHSDYLPNDTVNLLFESLIVVFIQGILISIIILYIINLFDKYKIKTTN